MNPIVCKFLCECEIYSFMYGKSMVNYLYLKIIFKSPKRSLETYCFCTVLLLSRSELVRRVSQR